MVFLFQVIENCKSAVSKKMDDPTKSEWCELPSRNGELYSFNPPLCSPDLTHYFISTIYFKMQRDISGRPFDSDDELIAAVVYPLEVQDDNFC